MEPLIGLLAIYLLAVLVVFPIWAIAKLLGRDEALRALELQLRALRDQLNQSQTDTPIAPTASGGVSTPVAPAARPGPIAEPPAAFIAATPPSSATSIPPGLDATTPPPVLPAAADAPAALPPLLPVAPASALEPAASGPSYPPPLLDPAAADAAADTSARPAPPPPPPFDTDPSAPPPPPVYTPTPPVYTPPPRRPAINWEQFMGAKLFAWLGGLALFLCVVFFVKYSFEHNLIPAQVRVAIGFVVGVGLIVGGLRLARNDRYRITAQTLVAAGVVSLYGVTFACNSIYHFAFFGPVPTFLLMTLITAAAFVLAVRLNAQVVAILGMLGGFTTPLLLNTGHDNAIGLFGYIAILIAGLAAVALRQGWFYLVPLGAAGMVLTLAGWANRFYEPAKTEIAMGICLGFCALFFATGELARRRGHGSPWLRRTAAALPVIAFVFTLYILGYSDISARSGLVFSFVALTSAFVFALAWREGQGSLIAGAAAMAAIIIIRWTVAISPAVAPSTVMIVCACFSTIYFVVALVSRRLRRDTLPVLLSAAALPALSLAFAAYFIIDGSVSTQPGALFGFIFYSDVLLLALAGLDQRVRRVAPAAGLAVFALLAAWTIANLTEALLPWELGAVLVFAALHAGFSLQQERRHGPAARGWASQLFPPLAVLLLFVPLVKSVGGSWLIWPALLVVDAIAIAAAVVTASLAAVAAVLVLTLAATGIYIFQAPASTVLEPAALLVLGGFAIFFFAAGLWLMRRLGARASAATPYQSALFGTAASQISAFSSLLPFLLLMMASARLAVPDPSALFGLGLLLVLLTLGLSALYTLEWLPLCALAGLAALEYIWHASHFRPRAAVTPLAWYFAFYIVFSIYPFVFRRRFASITGPWAVAALGAAAQFFLIYKTITRASPNSIPGAIPAAFALPALGSLLAILRRPAANAPARLNQLAWFGGLTLAFITLIFPIQFDRQWLTVAWALEGATLLWLFHRVPHAGLRGTAVVLLTVAFARLALNPAVLEYHASHGAVIFNWYLYAYGLVIASLFFGARLLAPPRNTVFSLNTPPLLYAFAVVLAFILLNIEIADYFMPPGARVLTFEFSGSFARDMSYTVGWALFALALLAAGIWRQQPLLRYAALALLSVALLKLFFHDLAQLEALYRVGALFAVAVIALLASVAYQRFLPAHDKSPPPPV